MDLKTLAKLNAVPKNQNLYAVDPSRTLRLYNPQTNTFKIIEEFGGRPIKNDSSLPSRDKTSAQKAESARHKRKDGKTTFKRVQMPIQALDVKIPPQKK